MNSNNKKLGLIGRYKTYKTRQQLRNLPTTQLRDIGKTQQDVIAELSKNSFIVVMKQSFRHLFKGA